MQLINGGTLPESRQQRGLWARLTALSLLICPTVVLNQQADALLVLAAPKRASFQTPSQCFISSSLPLEADDSAVSSAFASAMSRRRLFQAPILLSTATTTNAVVWSSPSLAFAATPSRQLEFCLVTVARAIYWAQFTARSLSDNISHQQQDPEAVKQAYFQARLGAKAILTGKVGGGATGQIYTLATLQIPGCLKDMQLYYSNTAAARTMRKGHFDDLKDDWTESLANIVEFDGLENLTDPSPRSVLTLQQYSPTKAVFVQRLLVERVIPLGRQLLQSFPEDARQRSRDYAMQYYASEMVELGEAPVL